MTLPEWPPGDELRLIALLNLRPAQSITPVKRSAEKNPSLSGFDPLKIVETASFIILPPLQRLR